MEVSDDYGWVLFLDVMIALECFMINTMVAGRVRRQIFTREFLDENYTELFQKELGKTPDPHGYPDMGSGRLADKLTFRQWYDFNVAQRVSNNFLEQVYLVILLIPIAGIEYGIPTIIFAALYFVGRLIYTIGYSAKGARGRMLGFIINSLSVLGLGVLSIMSAMEVQYGD